jgi:hypothetical protein
MLESGYFRAKIAQENLIKASSIPYSIVRATQFFEFVKGIADISTDGDKVRLPHVLFPADGGRRRRQRGWKGRNGHASEWHRRSRRARKVSPA